jgi:hypothetical protein
MDYLRNGLGLSLFAAMVVTLAPDSDTKAAGSGADPLDSLPEGTARKSASYAPGEGPHIQWQDDSSAVVLYLCGEQVVREVLRAADTLQFHGLCEDSVTEYLIPLAEPQVEPDVFKDVSKIFAVSDIHGEYEVLVHLLMDSEVIDDDLHWIWGDGHLVFLGDVFDRGDMVTETLWLIYRLEQEAKAVGGRVHYVLGNHEHLVMQGVERYVNKKYLRGIAKSTGIEYRDLYGPDTEMGRWLRSKNVVIRLNDILFVHGGLAPEVVVYGLTLNDMNEAARRNIDLTSKQSSATARFVFDVAGPLWYRGYYGRTGNYPRASVPDVDRVLEYYGAEAIVTGHSETRQVESLYGGRIFGIDVPVEELGFMQALLWQGDRYYRVTWAGRLEQIG